MRYHEGHTVLSVAASKKLLKIRLPLGEPHISSSGITGDLAVLSARNRRFPSTTLMTKATMTMGCVQGIILPPKLIPKMRQATLVVCKAKLVKESNHSL